MKDIETAPLDRPEMQPRYVWTLTRFATPVLLVEALWQWVTWSHLSLGSRLLGAALLLGLFLLGAWLVATWLTNYGIERTDQGVIVY